MPESRGAGRPGMFQVRRGHGTARETEQDAVRAGGAQPDRCVSGVSALDLACRRTLSRRMACLITSEAAFQ